MNRKDVVSMYEKGYSIDYISKELFKYKTKTDIKNHYFNGVYIVTPKSAKLKACLQEVTQTILDLKKQ